MSLIDRLSYATCFIHNRREWLPPWAWLCSECLHVYWWKPRSSFCKHCLHDFYW